MLVLDLVGGALQYAIQCFDRTLFPPHCLITGKVIQGNPPLPMVSVEGLDRCTAAPDAVELMLTAQRHCVADEIAFSSIAALWELHAHAPTHALMMAIKYRGHSKLAFALGATIGTTICNRAWLFIRFDEQTVVTFVPVHRTRRRERGYDQAQCIANGLAASLGTQTLSTLQRTRYTGTQTALNEVARANNMANAFGVRLNSNVNGKHVILVDDVFTTGATANAAATALILAGARRVDVVTVCATL